MSAEWYVYQRNKRYGPFSPTQMKQLASQGKISPETPVKKGTEGAWIRADQVAGLLPSASVPSPPQPPAQSGSDGYANRASSGQPRPAVVDVVCSRGSSSAGQGRQDGPTAIDYSESLVRCFRDSLRTLASFITPERMRIFVGDIPHKRLTGALASLVEKMTNGEKPVVLVDTSFIGHGSSGILLTDRACYHGKWSSLQSFAYADLTGEWELCLNYLAVKVILKNGKRQTVRAGGALAQKALQEFVKEAPHACRHVQCPKCGQWLACPPSVAPADVPCPSCELACPPSVAPTHVPGPNSEAALSKPQPSGTPSPAVTSPNQARRLNTVETWKRLLPEKESAYRPSGRAPRSAVSGMLLGSFLAILPAALVAMIARAIGAGFGLLGHALFSVGPEAAPIIHFVSLLALAAFIIPLEATAVGGICALIVTGMGRSGKNRNRGLAVLFTAFACYGATGVLLTISFGFLQWSGHHQESALVFIMIGGSFFVCIGACVIGGIAAATQVASAKFCEKCMVYMDSLSLRTVPLPVLPQLVDALTQGKFQTVVHLCATTKAKDAENELFVCPKCGAGYVDFFGVMKGMEKVDGAEQAEKGKWLVASRQLAPTEAGALRALCKRSPRQQATRGPGRR